MKLSVSVDLPAPPRDVLELLLSPEYLAEAVASADGIVAATEEERVDEGRQITHAVRWVAPTKLPSILKQFEGRAPQSVNWLERTVWDLDACAGDLTVEPDVPESWHSRYRSSGRVRIEPRGAGSRLSQELEFSMDFGLIGKALEKLLKNEIEALLEQRLTVLKRLAG